MKADKKLKFYILGKLMFLLKSFTAQTSHLNVKVKDKFGKCRVVVLESVYY